MTKETIKGITGIPIEKYYKNHPKFDEIMKSFGDKNFTVDTINGNLVCCPEFKVEKGDLHKKPLITDEEITGFDFQNSSILISKSGVRKLLELPFDTIDRKQFSICINGKPELNGYFLSIWSSFYSENYVFFYQPSLKKDSIENKNHPFNLFFGQEIRKIDSINEKTLYQALKKTGRLIN